MIFIVWSLLTLVVRADSMPTKEWLNPDCDIKGCEIKAVRLYVENSSNGQSAGTAIAAEMEATERDFLKDYLFVQYIKGCRYSISADGSREILTRSFFGKRRAPFIHKEWQIDTDEDQDPSYWSSRIAGYDPIRGFEIPRNADYATTSPLLSEEFSSWVGKVKNLESNSLYVYDAPSGSTLHGLHSKVEISSLTFKMCLYRAAQVPAKISTPDIFLQDPIACLDWDSNFGLNAEGKALESKAEIDPFCLM